MSETWRQARGVLGKPMVLVSLTCLTFFIVSSITAVIQRNSAYHMEESTDWVLLGGLSVNSIVFRIRIPAGATASLRIADTAAEVVSEQEFSAPEGDELYVHPVRVGGLQANTAYVYETFRGDTRKASGTFRTPTEDGEAFEFALATAGCAMTASKNAVFDRIRDHSPLFMAHLGDFHYKDIETNDMPLRIKTVDRVMGSPGQRALWANTPLAYTWDDHDWLGNNSDENEKDPGARDTALRSYQWLFPHYPLAMLGEGTTKITSLDEVQPVPTYHAFTIGTVRFIMTDLRSEANQNRIYSDAQRDWLFVELEQSSFYDFVILFTSKPWIGEAEFGEDNWMGASSDRTELSNLLSSLASRNVLAISSDAHMLGFDSGRNTYYGDVESMGSESDIYSFPILQSGPLDRLGSTKGGPFSDGCTTIKLERNHQYSIVSYVLASEQSMNEPCIRIRSYSGESLTMEKQLCGQIYTQVPTDGSKQGTCKSKILTTPSLALSISSLILTVMIGGFLAWKLPWKEGLRIFIVILVGLFATYGVGFGIPSVGDFPFSLVSTCILGFVQTVFIGVGLIFTLYVVPRKSSANVAVAQEPSGE